MLTVLQMRLKMRLLIFLRLAGKEAKRFQDPCLRQKETHLMFYVLAPFLW